MTGVATRDYKARRAPSVDARRVRDFGIGAVLGIALTAAAFLWAGAAAHRAPIATAVNPAGQAPAASAPPPGAAAAPAPDFGEILTHPQVQMSRQEQVLEASAAKAHRR